MRKELGVSVGLIAALLLGCGSDAQQQGAAMPPISVKTYVAQEDDLSITLEYPAKLTSSGFVEVRAKVGGALLSREYAEGTQVKKEALLFQIDPAKYEAAKDLAQAAFNQAEREYKRTQKLFSSNAVSERDRDATLAAYESTAASLKNAALDLDYTRVKAPIAGFAGQVTLDTGNLISAGTLLTTITKTDPLYVDFAFSNMEKLREGYELTGGNWANPTGIKVAIRNENGGTYKNEGTIDFVDAAIDMQTGSVRARASIQNADGRLMPGQFVRIVLSGVVKKDAVKIPPKR
jgi:membrane fusion protein (multidrug efflux system)